MYIRQQTNQQSFCGMMASIAWLEFWKEVGFQQVRHELFNNDLLEDLRHDRKIWNWAEATWFTQIHPLLLQPRSYDRPLLRRRKCSCGDWFIAPYMNKWQELIKEITQCGVISIVTLVKKIGVLRILRDWWWPDNLFQTSDAAEEEDFEIPIRLSWMMVRDGYQFKEVVYFWENVSAVFIGC